MIRLLITGEPATITAQQKGVNFAARKFYTKAAVEAEKRRIRRCMQIWNGTEFVKMTKPPIGPLVGPVHCSIKYVFPLTQEQAKKHADKLSDPNFEIHHGKRPDFDNLLKTPIDVLTKLGFWEDDGQVDDANVHKRRGTTPRILIAIKSCGVP
jgi:Holliday junction resolvase RusA-like endonuclease